MSVITQRQKNHQTVTMASKAELSLQLFKFRSAVTEFPVVPLSYLANFITSQSPESLSTQRTTQKISIAVLPYYGNLPLSQIVRHCEIFRKVGHCGLSLRLYISISHSETLTLLQILAGRGNSRKPFAASIPERTHCLL